MVTVDIDGNVELLGNPSVLFLINGKPSSIFGASLADALQSIPSSQIKSIEVITSPGAKYDASGTGGIINIILKDNKVQGYNGSVNASAGTRLENTSINLNAKTSKIGVNLFFSGNKTLLSKTLNTRTRTNISNDTTSNQFQNGYGDIQRNGFQSGIGFNWSLNKHDEISAGLTYHHFSNYTDGLTNQEDQQIKTGFAPLYDLLSIRNSNGQFGENAIEPNFEYKRTFKKDGQELNFQYNGSINSNIGNYYQKQDYIGQSATSSGSTGDNPGKDQEHEFKLDYSHPVTEDFLIETGAQTVINILNSASNVNLYDVATNTFIYNQGQSSNFTYGQNVYAYYISASFKLFDYFDIKSGLRDEYTTVTIGGKSGIVPDYNFLSPSFVVQHQIKKGQSIKLAYSKRIERPDFGYLNPFVNSSDPYNISFGNPNLHPEIGNNFEFGYNGSFKNGTNINITAFFRHNGFDVKQYSINYSTYKELDSTYNNVNVSTRANVGAEVQTGINASLSLPITKSLTIRPNMLFSQRRIMDNLANTPPFVMGYEYRLNINASYDFGHNMLAEAFANYNSPRVGLQGTNSSFVAYSFAARKQFLNKKASIGFTTSVPFNEYINQSSTITQQAPKYSYTYSLRQVPFRSFGITLSYKFGKLEFKKDEEKDPAPNLPQPDQQ